MPLQFTIPRRRPVVKSGIDRGPRLEWPRHEKWTRGFSCSVPGCECRPVRFHHLRNAANSSKGKKPHSAFSIPLCDEHHEEWHRGDKTFIAKHRIQPYRLAAWFLRNSPDVAMRASFYELPADVQRPLLEAAGRERRGERE